MRNSFLIEVAWRGLSVSLNTPLIFAFCFCFLFLVLKGRRHLQVWFQNRRSKERRMKQLSALGARRAFFRNPARRLRAFRDGMDDSPEMMGNPGFNYYSGKMMVEMCVYTQTEFIDWRTSL